MSASITKAGESLIAQKQASQQALKVARFVLANVPDLDVEAPVDRDALKPAPEHIVNTQDVTQSGFINPNQIVYSLMMGSDVGDFDWNWIGLETEEDVLLSVAYVPLQQKRKNIPPHQIGNNVTRNFLLVFDGAQELTQITIDASTWQHDFTVRLHGIDERERLSNRDVYGRFCCFAEALKLGSHEGQLYLTHGQAYVEGISLQLVQDFYLSESPAEFPASAWLDVALIRTGNNVEPQFIVRWGETIEDYIDANGVAHYCVPIADLTDATTFIDRRTVEPITGPVIAHLAARVGNYPNLRARATTKADVGLDQLPNAISDDPNTNSSEILASTAALNKLNQQISDSLVGMVASFDMETAPPGWLIRNGATVSRTVYAKLFAVLGTRYGAGDGTTTFNIGDSRAMFIRGVDNGRGIDPGRELGSVQQGQNATHTHTATAANGGSHTHTLSATTGAAGAHMHTVSGQAAEAGRHFHYHTNSGWVTNGGNATGGAGVGFGASDLTSAGAHTHTVSGTTSQEAAHTHPVTGTISAIGDHTHAITIAAAGGNEARPINQALLICIKY